MMASIPVEEAQPVIEEAPVVEKPKRGRPKKVVEETQEG